MKNWNCDGSGPHAQDLAVRRVIGKRITFDQLTGKDGKQEFVN